MTIQRSPQGISGPTSSGPSTVLPFDPFVVDAMSDADLDALAHGVIALDRGGVILRYNLAEANLARLDRHTVLGLNFFEEVAPCTRTAEFEGQFRRLVSEGQERVPRFSYLFDFKFGAQEVDVEMIKAREAERYYVFVTRRTFLEPRSGLADGWAAPRQEELAGVVEARHGVRRDALEQRLVQVDADFLATLFATAHELSATAWPRIAYEWGQRWGRRFAVSLEMAALQRTSQSLQELPFSRTMQLLQERLAECGWGDVSIDAGPLDQGVIRVEIDRSLVAELAEIRRSGHERSGVMLLEGLLAAVFSFLSGKQLTAVAAPGAPPGSNVFLVFGAGLRSAAVAAVSSGGARTPQALLGVVTAMGAP